MEPAPQSPEPNHGQPGPIQTTVRLGLKALGNTHAPAKLALGVVAAALCAWETRWFEVSAGAVAAAPLYQPRPSLGVLPGSQAADLALNAALAPARWVIMPWSWLFQPHSSWTGFGLTLAEALAAYLVATFLGAIIARMTVVWLTGRDRPSLAASARFVASRAHRILGAPLCPLIGIGVIMSIGALLGLPLRLPEPVGSVVGTFTIPLATLLAIPVALLLIGMAAGWPIAVLSFAAEDTDILDAVSRAFAYVLQRKALFLGLAAAGILAAAAGMVAFTLVLDLVVHLARSMLSLGAGTPPGSPDRWNEAANLLALGWSFSAFWSLASVAYLILRWHVDGSPVSYLREFDQPDPASAPDSDA